MNPLDIIAGLLVSTLSAAVAFSITETLFTRRNGQKNLRGHETSRLEKQLPGLLERISSDVSAGRSLQQSLQSVASERKHPFSPLLTRVFDLVSANQGLSDALESVAQETGSPPLRLSLISMAISNRTGSNIVNALQVLARLCLDREKVRQKILSQSAQGRMQGVILILVPIVFLIALSIVSPHSLKLVTASQVGQGLLTAAFALNMMGALLIMRMIRQDKW
jgi:tight adherence protein B